MTRFGGCRQDVDGTKLFVHNVSEETSQDELKKAFGKHGSVTDAYNPGKGFAFITYSSPDEAQAAISAMNGTVVCGRKIECAIARPNSREGRGGRGGGRGGGNPHTFTHSATFEFSLLAHLLKMLLGSKINSHFS